jgi:chloride channel protein, CIC family
VSSLLIAGVFGGVAWFLLRRYTRDEPSEIDDAVWSGDGRLSLRRRLGTSVISEVVIGMGASIGREAAPKLLSGASASVPWRPRRDRHLVPAAFRQWPGHGP